MVNNGRTGRYQERLRSIGARLDASGFHSVSILEVDDGLIVRATPPGSRTPEVLEMVDDEPPTLPGPGSDGSGVPHRLFSHGYAQFLEALGHRLDRSRAAAIAIVEGTDFVTVGGLQPVDETDGAVTYELLDILLLADDIRAISTQTPLPITEMPSVRDVGHRGASKLTTTVGPGLAHRVSSAVASVVRTIQPGQNPARSRG